MRFDTPIFMQKITQGAYDSETGNYGDDAVEEVQLYANISDTGASAMNLLYGKIVQGSLTIRLQNQYNEPFDYIRVGERVYRADYERKLHIKHTFVVSEVQR